MLNLSAWFRRPRRPIRQPSPQATRPSLETLEDRTVPATVSYNVTTHFLQFTATPGIADNVTVTAPAANQVVIQVGSGDTIALAGDALSNADFSLSGDLKTLTINTEPSTHSPLDHLDVQLGDMDDTLVLGLANANHNVGSITVDGQAGNDTVYLNALTLPGDLTVSADTIVLQGAIATTGSGAISLTAGKTISLVSGSSLATADGDLTLNANEDVTPLSGNFMGIVLNHAAISSVNGNVLLQGRGGNDSASGLHVGIDVFSGSTISSTGTGTITLNGTGGSGTDYNYGLGIDGSSTLVTSVNGAVQLTGTGGAGTGQQNVGVYVLNGARITSTGTGGSAASITVNGTGGSGTGYDVGVYLNGSTTKITTVDGPIQLTGQATAASGSEHGLLIVSSAIATTNNASITLTGNASTAVGAPTGDGILMFAPAILSLGTGNVDFFGTAAGSMRADVEWDDLTLAKTGGSIAFHGKARGQSLTVQSGVYAVNFLGGGDIIDAVTFNNSGGVMFGDAATDVMNIFGGVTSTASTTTITGKLQTSNADVHLGTVMLTDALINAGTNTVFLTGDVTWLGSSTPGQVFGTVDLGGVRTFTVADGSAAIDLTLVGPLVDGSLIKNGPGVLQLLSGGTYTGGTTVNTGTLLVNNATGSATGTGGVVVQGGTLGGNGTITGQIKVLSGMLSPSAGMSPAFLRSPNLTLSNTSTFWAAMNAPYAQPGVDYDGMFVKGTVNLNGAALVLFGGTTTAKVGTFIWLIQNDGADPVKGTFAGLPEGATVTFGKVTGQISYKGGDGNDVVIRVTKSQGTGAVSLHRVVAVPAPAGQPAIVKVYTPGMKKFLFQFQAYPKSYLGGVRVAIADVNGDGYQDIIVVKSSNEGPNQVKIFSGKNGQLLKSFMAPTGLMGSGGMWVAAGDVTGDHRAEIMLGSGAGVTPEVLVINGATLTPLQDVFPTGTFPDGVEVQAVDPDGDGIFAVSY